MSNFVDRAKKGEEIVKTRNSLLRWIVFAVVSGLTMSAVPHFQQSTVLSQIESQFVAKADCGYDNYPGCDGPQGEDIVNTTNVVVDGRTCNVDHIILYMNRTYLPLRAFSECLGLHVEWFPSGFQGYTSVAQISGATYMTGDTFIANFKPVAEDYKMWVDYGDGTHKEFKMDVPPFIYDNRTYVPFRFVTDLMNVKVEWIPRQEGINGGMAQVRVSRNHVAEPIGQWDTIANYVGYTNSRGFYMLPQPSGGWPVYPSVLLETEISLQLYNAVAQSGEVEMDWNGFRVREQGRYGPIDHFGGVATVIWIKDDEALIDYKTHLASEGRGNTIAGLIASGVFSISVGGFATLWKSLSTVATLGIGGWAVWQSDWTASVDNCSAKAGLAKYKSQQPNGAPAMFGMLITPSGQQCVPFYTDNPMNNAVNIGSIQGAVS
jgi:hypothetical protein